MAFELRLTPISVGVNKVCAGKAASVSCKANILQALTWREFLHPFARRPLLWDFFSPCLLFSHLKITQTGPVDVVMEILSKHTSPEGDPITETFFFFPCMHEWRLEAWRQAKQVEHGWGRLSLVTSFFFFWTVGVNINFITDKCTHSVRTFLLVNHRTGKSQDMYKWWLRYKVMFNPHFHIKIQVLCQYQIARMLHFRLL